VNEERILAIDYGTKRIGLAVTDPLKMFAIPFDTIPNDKHTLDKLKQIISEKNVVKIILGNPVKENGEDSTISKDVRKFKSELEKKIDLAIELVDERYSSDIAAKRILESVPSKKKRRNKSLVDKNAAAVILEDYLKEI
jgi:putative Holliday junction resolvase